jgi:dihydropteroate synthase
MSDVSLGRRGPAPRPMVIRGRRLDWGARTYVMGIVNVTADSFSGDGLLAGGVAAALSRALAMAAEGADILDIGGESTRPGYEAVSAAEEIDRVVPVVRAIRAALPEMPLSIDTTKVAVAAAALDAGADLVNDVAGTTGGEVMVDLVARRRVPWVLMHGRRAAPFQDVVGEVVADLAAAIDRAVGLGCDRDGIIVDPGIGFGKSPAENLALIRDLDRLADLRRPVLLGASRKSTIGRVLGLPPDQRLEGTLATTAIGIARGVDIVRVHDVAANLRTARMADAVIRGWRDE